MKRIVFFVVCGMALASIAASLSNVPENNQTAGQLNAAEIKAKAKKWVRKNIRTRFLSNYKNTTQKEYREKLNNIQALVSEMAVVYTNADNKLHFDECIQQLNNMYSADSLREWSRLGRPTVLRVGLSGPEGFDKIFDVILNALSKVIENYGDKCGYEKRREMYWLNYVAHVKSWNELDAKIAAEKARKQEEKEARAEWREERKVQADEERNQILRGINRSLDNMERNNEIRDMNDRMRDLERTNMQNMNNLERINNMNMNNLGRRRTW